MSNKSEQVMLMNQIMLLIKSLGLIQSKNRYMVIITGLETEYITTYTHYE